MSRVKRFGTMGVCAKRQLNRAARYEAGFDTVIKNKSGHTGHTVPFVERLTRAHSGFEVKDAPKARRLRRS